MTADHSGTLAVSFVCDDLTHDLAVAELAAVGCYAFERTESTSTAYAHVSVDVADEIRTRLAALQQSHPVNSLDFRVIEPVNWNARWEASVSPVSVPPFVIRPSWAAGNESAIEIVIDPKMSFGTAHHESTRLILGWLPAMMDGVSSVLDAGTGTGVLAIAAARLGAAEVVAFDNDPWSVTNARENIEVNQVQDTVRVLEGDLSVVSGSFDLVLANINRNVLLDSIGGFAQLLAAGGRLVLAGLLRSDRSTMLDALERTGYHVVDESVEGEWLSIVAALKP